MGRGPVRADRLISRAMPLALPAALAIPGQPVLELAARDAKEAARPGDLARDLLVVFDHAHASSGLTALLRWDGNLSHPGPLLLGDIRRIP